MVRADRQRAPMEGSRPKPLDVPKGSRSSPSRLPPMSLDDSHGREPNHHRTTIEPSVKQAAERPQERLADDGLPEMSAEQIEANKRRLRELLATMGGSPNFRTHQPQRLGDLMPRAKKSTTNHRQPNEVANGASHKQPNTPELIGNYIGNHIGNLMRLRRTQRTQRTVRLYTGCLKKGLKTVIRNQS
jgi:hypothetical protein